MGNGCECVWIWQPDSPSVAGCTMQEMWPRPVWNISSVSPWSRCPSEAKEIQMPYLQQGVRQKGHFREPCFDAWKSPPGGQSCLTSIRESYANPRVKSCWLQSENHMLTQRVHLQFDFDKRITCQPMGPSPVWLLLENHMLTQGVQFDLG